MKRMAAAERGEWDVVEALEAAEAKAKPRIVKSADEKSLARKITDSTLYDHQPAARFLLVQLAVLAMKEESDYPEDSPFQDDKVGWCWMSQEGLSLKIGTDSGGRTVRNWITRFIKDEVIIPRKWRDDNGTPHSEYKVVESVVDANQRPPKKKDAIAVRGSRNKEGSRKANKGSFTTANQPGRGAQQGAIMEEDDE